MCEELEEYKEGRITCSSKVLRGLSCYIYTLYIQISGFLFHIKETKELSLGTLMGQ